MNKLFALLLAAGLVPQVAQADVFITEWMYNGDEFIEFTNLGTDAVDFTGWSFDDDSRVAGRVSLSAFGLVAAGESVILAESSVEDFLASWGLSNSVKIIGGNTTNLGRSDEINLFDASNALVDRLTYGDNTFPGTIRTQNTSGRPVTFAALGANDVSQWVLSSVGDADGAYVSGWGMLGSPGTTQFAAAVPEPETYAMLLAGLGLIGIAARRRR